MNETLAEDSCITSKALKTMGKKPIFLPGKPASNQWRKIQPSMRRCHIGDTCENYFVMTGKLVPTERKGSVQLPGELAASVYQMMQEDKWTIFWHPTRLTDLTTSAIQSVICAALNSRRRLLFVIGVASNSKLYQLSSGRIFYVNRGSVVRHLSFNDAYNMLLRRKTEVNRVSENQPNKMRVPVPCLRGSGTIDSSLLKRVFLFGFPGFVVGLLAYDYLPKMLRN
ncbi:unnamed protein product [Angiostrongylus costaricensis]|uniref:Transmembrane protein n=1 Tax=Angiostrongylus costaricensis TaxID=334426 RepID=A0A158PGJ2_ANGCS|nr:unnamed protein product [Angiostrongylus costaricensis]